MVLQKDISVIIQIWFDTCKPLIEVFKHIQKHTTSTQQRPILLIFDNHEFHVSLEAINYSVDIRIVYLSIPLDMCFKFQPFNIGKQCVTSKAFQEINETSTLKLRTVPETVRRYPNKHKKEKANGMLNREFTQLLEKIKE